MKALATLLIIFTLFSCQEQDLPAPKAEEPSKFVLDFDYRQSLLLVVNGDTITNYFDATYYYGFYTDTLDLTIDSRLNSPIFKDPDFKVRVYSEGNGVDFIYEGTYIDTLVVAR